MSDTIASLFLDLHRGQLLHHPGSSRNVWPICQVASAPQRRKAGPLASARIQENVPSTRERGAVGDGKRPERDRHAHTGHRTKEFRTFLDEVERNAPADLDVRVVMDGAELNRTLSSHGARALTIGGGLGAGRGPGPPLRATVLVRPVSEKRQGGGSCRPGGGASPRARRPPALAPRATARRSLSCRARARALRSRGLGQRSVRQACGQREIC